MDPLPEDAWELLGLDPDAARQRDVKRAYARLIKIHRPDADPDNFRRVHEAYREALAWLKECEAEGDASEIFSDEIAFEYENPARPEDLPAETACEDAQPLESQRDRRSPGVPPALPASFASARNALADALENPDKTDLAGPFAAFRQASLAGADLTCQWVDALEGWAEMHFVDLARQLSSDDVLRLIDACRGDLPRSVMDFWHSQADYRRLVALAKLLLARVPPPDHPVAVFCMAQLAGLLAFSHANGAEKLADKAYPHLPPGSREWVMERLDRRLAAGKHFRGLDPRQARFWEHRLFDAGDETFDWSTPSAQAALSYLTMNRRSDWSGLPMIRSVVPELIFSDLERRLRRRGASAPGGQRVRPIPSKKSRWIWSVLAVLILLANFLVDGLRRKPGNMVRIRLRRIFQRHPRCLRNRAGARRILHLESGGKIRWNCWFRCRMPPRRSAPQPCCGCVRRMWVQPDGWRPHWEHLMQRRWRSLLSKGEWLRKLTRWPCS